MIAWKCDVTGKMAPPAAVAEPLQRRLLQDPFQTARALAKRLQDLGHHVWIDIDMNEPSKQEMTRGIRRHKTFLLFLTKGSLLREFCQYELRLAIRLQKQIVIVDEEPSPHPDRGGALAFQTYIDDAQRGDDVFCDASESVVISCVGDGDTQGRPMKMAAPQI